MKKNRKNAAITAAISPGWIGASRDSKRAKGEAGRGADVFISLVLGG
jgi:hypothetical protein